MDGEIANAPNVSQPKQTPKKGLLFEILFVILVLVLVFGTLNYFNILPISKLWPNQFGFLPHKQSKQESNVAIQQSNNVTPIPRTKIFCPSVKEFCEKGEGVIKDQKYIGLGYRLSSGSAIFAAFDGNLTSTKSAYPIEVNGKTTQENFKIVYLDNPDLRLRAIYFFRGKAKDIKTGKISKGQQIAVSGKPIAIYDNNSLIFSLIPGYPAINTPAILSKEAFE